MQSVEQIQTAIDLLLNSKQTSEWLKWSLRSCLIRDPVDASDDSEVLANLMNCRLMALFAESGIPEPAM